MQIIKNAWDYRDVLLFLVVLGFALYAWNGLREEYETENREPQLTTPPANDQLSHQNNNQENTDNQPTAKNKLPAMDHQFPAADYRQQTIVLKPQTPNAKPVIDIQQLEKEVFAKANFQRQRAGRKQLRWNDNLVAVAQQYSSYLAQQNNGIRNTFYLAHEDMYGLSHDARLEKLGIFFFDKSAENLHANSIVKAFLVDEENTPIEYNTAEELAEKAVTGWMRSPAHRQNLISDAYDETGIGIATDATGTNYLYTQLFIHRAICGYKTGRCCEKTGFLPYCFNPQHCSEERVCE